MKIKYNTAIVVNPPKKNKQKLKYKKLTNKQLYLEIQNICNLNQKKETPKQTVLSQLGKWQ